MMESDPKELCHWNGHSVGRQENTSPLMCPAFTPGKYLWKRNTSVKSMMVFPMQVIHLIFILLQFYFYLNDCTLFDFLKICNHRCPHKQTKYCGSSKSHSSQHDIVKRTPTHNKWNDCIAAQHRQKERSKIELSGASFWLWNYQN